MANPASLLPGSSTTNSLIHAHMSNLLRMFGIEEAMDKLCDSAGVERIDWDNLMTDETREEIGRDCVECATEAKNGSKYCDAC